MTISVDNLLGHGMGTTLEDKDWAHISLVELTTLQRFYFSLKGDINIVWRSPRPFSSAAIIDVVPENELNPYTTASYFIKRSHRSFRTAKDILQEHAVIQHLASKAIPVSVLMSSDEGKTALEIGDWTYEVHKKAQGFDLYAEQQSWTAFFYPEHAAKAGGLLAKLHVAMLNFSEQHNRSAHYLVSNQKLLQSENIVDAIQSRIETSPELSQYFQNKVFDQAFLDRITSSHQQIKKTLQQATPIWTHNDLHASNLLWSEQSASAEISTVFDFGLADRNSAVYDLAIAIERNFIDWLSLENATEIAIDEAGLTAFLKAYFSEIHVQEDFSVLPELLKIVHLDFAFSELEYFVGITKNEKHADAAYYDWMIGHIDWFYGQQGQQFIQTLKRLIAEGIGHE